MLQPLLVLVLFVAMAAEALGGAAPSKPNIIFILADDLGYGDLSCFGQTNFTTPALDRMGGEGLKFTSAYAGSTVCAPSRCVLMTGLHTGHARIRGNSRDPLADEDVTVAEVLQWAGYATGLIGKWGLGEEKTSGSPIKQGFDYYFGYLNQVHAHDYYPTNLWRNDELVPLPENLNEARKVYTHDLFTEEALRWVKEKKETNFFLYLAYTIPHANNERKLEGMEIPDALEFKHQEWPEPMKNTAAMIKRLDRDVGRLLSLLKELGIDRRTLVVFSSDNGPHKESGRKPEFFQSSGKLRGIKRDLYEGGIRVPTIAWWPGAIQPGTTDYPCGFWDFLPTAADLAGAEVPGKIDGISLVPILRGGVAASERTFYWEFHEGGFKQAVRRGKWKGVRLHPELPLELYDLDRDPGESVNLAHEHPARVQELTALLHNERMVSERWPIKAGVLPVKTEEKTQ